MAIDTRLNYPRHFDGKRFYNPDSGQARGLLDVLRWKTTSRAEGSPRFVDDVRPSVPPGRVEGGLRATMVNHSTVLLQQKGCNLVTDPVWCERASPVTWAGPRRRRRAGVAFEQLPALDAVLISHNHYDHFDVAALRRLGVRGETPFVVPAGCSQLLRSLAIERVHELEWGESISLAGCTIHCVSALHFSGRGMFDRNRTLWCGYIVETEERRVYFAGDTGFGRHFAQIRERFGPPDLALLPIGAYEPRWFMKAVHMNPEEAVAAHGILGAKTSIAIHHGTFQLADDGLDTPAKLLRQRAAGESFLVLQNGEFVEIP